MESTTPQADWIYSSYAEIPDLAELVDIFVAEMPERVQNLLARLDDGNWEELRRAAHQLKGAGGSYGFAPITPAAARVEQAIRNNLPEAEIRRSVEDLTSLCRRMRGGTP